MSRCLAVVVLLVLPSCAAREREPTVPSGCWWVDCNMCCPIGDGYGCTTVGCVESLPGGDDGE
jgi:hypothetical protein